ncbi:hypothetical protein [Sodalis-like endosymbiont of Proechinophthirus fluctus]|uniref:hypothetical protein n=1 Tax=Sodalis-like endosymbiont of Proechinophthirus fluctus TaxID=1462730 RepID=UPI001FCC3118|nr:hypothetical protein [Sodalis-like endosymbiont of Proechinophthirus fluctus]
MASSLATSTLSNANVMVIGGHSAGVGMYYLRHTGLAVSGDGCHVWEERGHRRGCASSAQSPWDRW